MSKISYATWIMYASITKWHTMTILESHVSFEKSHTVTVWLLITKLLQTITYWTYQSEKLVNSIWNWKHIYSTKKKVDLPPTPLVSSVLCDSHNRNYIWQKRMKRQNWFHMKVYFSKIFHMEYGARFDREKFSHEKIIFRSKSD